MESQLRWQQRTATQSCAPVANVPTQAAVSPNIRSTGTLTRLSEAEADLVMAQAINAHEMRRQ